MCVLKYMPRFDIMRLICLEYIIPVCNKRRYITILLYCIFVYYTVDKQNSYRESKHDKTIGTMYSSVHVHVYHTCRPTQVHRTLVSTHFTRENLRKSP